ncbi:hypothetical protein KVG29_00845 [Caldicoprobacter algeriensis]|nr:hypothetical protein [Caldicoprobacter algeriensis]
MAIITNPNKNTHIHSGTHIIIKSIPATMKSTPRTILAVLLFFFGENLTINPLTSPPA